MDWSLRLFTVRGISVRVHVTFLLVMVWAGYVGLGDGRMAVGLPGGEAGLRDLVFMEVFVLLLFACVVLHELGHALTAQAFKVRVTDITLWPIGGLAHLERMPSRPYQEFLISAAGPTTNFVLAIVFAVVLLLGMGPANVLAGNVGLRELLAAMARNDGLALIFLLLEQNALLALFNLVPAFPMDGGRLLRSFLAALLPFAWATRLASYAGQLVAIVMIGVGLVVPNLWLFSLVGLFVLFSAGQERQAVLSYNQLTGLCVRHAVQPLGARLHPLQTLGQAAGQLAHTAQGYYVVVDAGRLVGVLSRGDILAGLRRAGPNARVGQHMTRDLARLRPDEPLLEVRERMPHDRMWVAVVIEDGRVLGTVSPADMARLADLRAAYPGFIPD